MLKKVFVDCFRDGSLLASYDSSTSATLGGPPPAPDDKDLIDEAKVSLVNDRLAAWPCDGVVFRVRST